MKRYLPFTIVGAVALATFGSGAVLYRAKRPPTLTISTDQSAPGSTAGESTHIRGSANAPVTLEEYGDYQCPPCGLLAEPINQLEKEHRPNLRLIFRNFPLATHAHAREAAIAAEAAGLQGKFWEMHDLLYREQSIWSKATDARTLFNSYGGILGLEIERFKKDMDGDKAKDRVEADQKHGNLLGVQNTPTIFLNNKAIDPKNLNPAALRETIDAALKGNQAP
jgi:protein-disulfide isomerase